MTRVGIPTIPSVIVPPLTGTSTKNLLFKFSGETRTAIHSYFVFFDFLAVWLNRKNKIIESEIVKPFTLTARPKKKFYSLIEIPINKKNRKLIKRILRE